MTDTPQQESLRERCPNCENPNPEIKTMPDGSCGVCAGTGFITWEDTGIKISQPQQESWRTRFRSEFFIELESYIDSGYPQKVEAFISSERTRLLDEVRGLKEMKYEETYTPMGEKAARNQLRRKLLESLDTLGEK